MMEFVLSPEWARAGKWVSRRTFGEIDAKDGEQEVRMAVLREVRKNPGQRRGWYFTAGWNRARCLVRDTRARSKYHGMVHLKEHARPPGAYTDQDGQWRVRRGERAAVSESGSMLENMASLSADPRSGYTDARDILRRIVEAVPEEALRKFMADLESRGESPPEGSRQARSIRIQRMRKRVLSAIGVSHVG